MTMTSMERYQKMLSLISKFEEQGISHDNAVYEAFKALNK